MGNRCYEWIDEPWDRVRDMIPKSRMGRPRKDDRVMVNAMLWLARSGARWADIPEGYGPWKTVYSRFCKWRDEGTFLRIFEALNQDADQSGPPAVSIKTGCSHPVLYGISVPEFYDDQGTSSQCRC